MKLLITALLFIIATVGRAQYTFLPVSDSCGTFGFACSVTAATPNSMLQTIYLVNNNKKDQLLKWLLSDNCQNNIYGFVGLYFLHRNGSKLTLQERKSMAVFKNKDSLINSCIGCSFGHRKSSKLLSHKRLKRYYSWYTRSHMDTFFIETPVEK